MIVVYHYKTDAIGRDRAVDLMCGHTPNHLQIALETWESAGYEAVALVDSENMDFAFRFTNNVDTSWSQEPVSRITVLGPGYIRYKDNRAGYRSSSVGDIFVKDGKAFVVSSFGFTPLPTEPTGGAPPA